jgi:ferredoxin
MVDGKARLLRDDYCDGLGDCLPTCPTSAITFVEREAAAYDEVAVLRQWPVQIKLVPVNAAWFNGADLLVAADCSAYAYANFHQDFIRRHITLIGCPKLDAVDYSDKLTEIFTNNDILSVTVVRMEVPCCGGIENAVKTALENSGKRIPCNVVTISTDGRVL